MEQMHDSNMMGDMAGMEQMSGMGDMSAMLGPVVFGNVHLGVLLMFVTGILYFFCALALWKPYKQEKNELMGALLAFFCYQTISMIFMGIEMHTMNLLYSNIAALSIFLGSTYMLKFPLSPLPDKVRKFTFLGLLVAVIGLFVWFITSPGGEEKLMHFSLWYDLVVNGIVAGGAIILFGLRASERRTKIKALGGGTGVVSCCVAANAAMIGGSLIASAIFQFLAPLFILGAITKGRSESGSNSAPQPAQPAQSFTPPAQPAL